MEENIFLRYVHKKTIFKDKKVLHSAYIPQKIFFRDSEIENLTSILASSLNGYQSNNVFIYGTCGTGKTICCKFILSHLAEMAKKQKKNIKTIYVNCKMKKVADTEYRLLVQLLREFDEILPDTGLPTELLYRRFFEKIEEKKQGVIIILDEIDALFNKIGDEFLYNLVRINSELDNSYITLIGITNDVSFREKLDQRVKSSLGEEEILFKPYNATQLKNILLERASEGFSVEIDESVFNKCAAIAAQEHGDARKALDLLRITGEICERSGDTRLVEKHVDAAEQKLDIDRITETIKAQPRQSQAVLHAIIKLDERRQNNGKKWVDSRLLTGDVFGMYKEICIENNLKPLTQRRVGDLLSELDMLGIISTRVVSNGRYGRSREISIAVNNNAIEKGKQLLVARFG